MQITGSKSPKRAGHLGRGALRAGVAFPSHEHTFTFGRIHRGWILPKEAQVTSGGIQNGKQKACGELTIPGWLGRDAPGGRCGLFVSHSGCVLVRRKSSGSGFQGGCEWSPEVSCTRRSPTATGRTPGSVKESRWTRSGRLGYFAAGMSAAWLVITPFFTRSASCFTHGIFASLRSIQSGSGVCIPRLASSVNSTTVSRRE